MGISELLKGAAQATVAARTDARPPNTKKMQPGPYNGTRWCTAIHKELLSTETPPQEHRPWKMGPVR